MRKVSILIVDDEIKLCKILMEIFTSEGYDVSIANNGKECNAILKAKKFDIVFLDLKLPDTNGVKILNNIKADYPDTSVVMISAYATVPITVEALKLGAEDVIEKSFDMQKIIQITKNLVEKRSLKRQKDNLTKNLLEKYEILGESNEIVKLKAIIEKVAPTNASILILGETGVGKELVARNIHIRSQRSDSPYIKVNCAALPGELIESELFGHEKGSFTGAISTKKGQFEMADNGTLFLDEIGDMTLHAQAKVLRALESGEIMKIGGDNEIHVDVRLITATNQNIKELIHSKLFREDLFHRINVVEIKVPSLAERISDIPLLASHFLELYCYENNMPVRIIDRSAEKYLMNCAWPGNIRQLRHTIEKIIVLSDSKVINAEIVEKILKQPDLINDKLCENEDFDALQLYDKKKYFEKNYIITALNKNHWHITKTASELGMDRSTLFRKMKSLDIKR